MRTILVLELALLVLTGQAKAEETNQLHLMPWPTTVEVSPDSGGELVIQTSFAVSIPQQDQELRRAVEIFLNNLRRHTGSLPLDFSLAGDPRKAQLTVESKRARNQNEVGDDESYTLQVTSSRAELKAVTSLGAMRGLVTFLQLVQVTPQGFAVPSVNIQDRPRFPWRGLLIDSSRHFMPVEVIERNLDGMAAVKMNVLHWHLSDDQGFRVESKRFPKLHNLGSDGLYYTHDQVRRVIQYAADRGIRVVPEFDMPGHSTAWFAAYPDLASAPGPYSIERKWGVFDPAMDPTRETTYRFLDQFVGEMAALFPDPFFHIGGDEVNGKQWDQSPQIQRFMRAHRLENNKDLQAYFNMRLEKIVRRHGKIMEGWDEILRPDLPKTVLVQSWRGQQSLADAARQGYRGVLSFGYYLDLIHPASAHYQIDPLSGAAAQLTEAEKQRILGGEACMWAEYVSPETIDSRIWPRVAAIAERLWSQPEVADIDSMYRRLDWISRWLDAYGLMHNTNYELMLERVRGNGDSSALRTLADVVEPVKEYQRGELATSPQTALMPLNRMVDAARPESRTARRFEELVNQFVAGRIKPGMEIELRSLFSRWRDNARDLRPWASESSLVEEVMPLAESLSALGGAGLEALDYLDRAERASDRWKALQLATIEQARQPRGQLVLAIIPSFEKLVEATVR